VATPIINVSKPASPEAVAPAPGASDRTPIVNRRPAATSWVTGSYALAVPAVAAILLAALVVPRRSALAQAPGGDRKPDAVEASLAELPATRDVTAALSAASTARAMPAAPITRSDPGRFVGEPNNAAVKAPQTAAAIPAARATSAPDADTREPEATEAKLATPESSAKAAIAAVSAPEATVGQPTVTITGCLEMSAGDDRFRLTDTQGASAPKSRSWKTGFLRKRSAAVNLVGDVDARTLEHQVGKRVAVTGAQADRDITVSSVRVVSASCD
jgi:hypothetical protein